MKMDVPPVTFLLIALSIIALVIQIGVIYQISPVNSEPKQILCSLAGEAYLQLENNQVHRAPKVDDHCVSPIKEIKEPTK